MLGYSHDTFPQRVQFRTRIVSRGTSGASPCREMLNKRYAGSIFLLWRSPLSGHLIRFCVPLISSLCISRFHIVRRFCIFVLTVPEVFCFSFHFLQEAAYLFFIVPFAYFPHPIGNRSTQMRFHPSLVFSLSGSAWIVSP